MFIRSSFVALSLGCLATVASAQGELPKIPDDTEIIELPSGLKYSVLQAGDGSERPRLGDRVRVHYSGWLEDGALFDSSRQRGEPAEFQLGNVIEGWNEGLTLMSPGARFKLTIPYQLAYGERGRPPRIPARSTLIFDVELIAITERGPVFRAPDPAQLKTTESGLKYQVLEAGAGPLCQNSAAVQLKFAFWTTEGKFCGAMRQGGRCDQMPLPILKEGPLLMREGSKFVFEVPPALAFGEQEGVPIPPNSTSIWEIELVNIFDVPEFAMPADDALRSTASGLRYEVLREGTGAQPTSGSRVEVHYSGWLTDGTGFDSSYERGEPATFGVGQVISGWTEGLQLMKEGAVFKFVIPPDLGYGRRGSPPTIPAEATLVFQVELLKVVQ